MIAACRPGIRKNGLVRTIYRDCATVTDAFNRADYGDHTLGFADTGQRWINVPGAGWGHGDPFVTDAYWTTAGSTANKAQMTSIALDHYRASRTAIDTGGNNQDVTISFSTADDDYIGFVVRCTADTVSGYEIGFSGYGSGGAYKRTPTGSTTLATWSSTSLNAPHTTRIRTKDNTLKVWRDGTLIADVVIDPDDIGGNPETDWTYFAIQQNHGGSGGSAPTQPTVYANTWAEDLSISGPAIPRTESFNATDNYPSGPIVTDGITWTIGGGAGNYGRSGGKLIFDGHDSDSFNTAAVVTLECGSGDGTVTATGVRNTTSTYGTGLAWRQSAPGTFWFIETSASSTHGQGAVRRAVSGHTTATTYLTIGTLPDNATLSVVLAGPLMTFYVNGTNVGTVTDSTDATASKHGVASDRGGGFGSVDSFTYA